MVDNSGSIGFSNFRKVKNFLVEMVDYFDISKDGTHVAMITFDHFTYDEFNFKAYYTKNAVKEAIRDVYYSAGATYTGEALEHLRYVQKLFSTIACACNVG